MRNPNYAFKYLTVDILCSPLVGIYSVAKSIQRKLPTQTDEVTHEVIHSSVLEQTKVVPELRKVLDTNPAIVAPLLPWEAKMKAYWAVKLQTASKGAPNEERIITTAYADPPKQGHHDSLLHKASDAVKHLVHSEDLHKEHVKDWLGKLVHESSIGPVVKEFL